MWRLLTIETFGEDDFASLTVLTLATVEVFPMHALLPVTLLSVITLAGLVGFRSEESWRVEEADERCWGTFRGERRDLEANGSKDILACVLLSTDAKKSWACWGNVGRGVSGTDGEEGEVDDRESFEGLVVFELEGGRMV